MTGSTAARSASRPSSWIPALYGAFGQSEVSVIYKPLNYYYVVLEVAPQFSQGPEGLKYIYLPTSGGGAIPLSAVARSHADHDGRLPSTTRACFPR